MSTPQKSPQKQNQGHSPSKQPAFTSSFMSSSKHLDAADMPYHPHHSLYPEMLRIAFHRNKIMYQKHRLMDLLRNMKLLDKIASKCATEDILLNLVDRLKVSRYPKNSIVFEQGDGKNKNYFMIVGGKVEVWVRDVRFNDRKEKERQRKENRLEENFIVKVSSCPEPEAELPFEASVRDTGNQTIGNDDDLEKMTLSSKSELEAARKQDHLECLAKEEEEIENIRNSRLGSRNELFRMSSTDLIEDPKHVSVGLSKFNLKVNGANVMGTRRRESLLLQPTPKTNIEKRNIRIVTDGNRRNSTYKNQGFKYLQQLVPGISPTTPRSNSGAQVLDIVIYT